VARGANQDPPGPRLLANLGTGPRGGYCRSLARGPKWDRLEV